MIIEYLNTVLGAAPVGYEYLTYIFGFFLLVALLAIVFSIFYKIVYYIFS